MKQMIFASIRHIKCHQVISTCTPNDGRPSVDCLLVKISCYGHLGDHVPGFCPCIVKMRELTYEFSKFLSSKTKFIFNELLQESVGEDYFSYRRSVLSQSQLAYC